MQRIYTLVFFFFCSGLAQAQIQTVPLQGNPILQQLAEEEQQKRLERWDKIVAQANEKNDEICPLEEDGVFYLRPGEPVTFFIDTIGFDTLGGTLECLNCTETQFGTAEFFEVGDSAFISYVADENILGAAESVLVEFCQNSGNQRCFELTYPVVIRRPDGSIRLPGISFPPEQDTSFCLDVSSLPGEFSCARVLEPDLPTAPCGDFYEGNSFTSLSSRCLYYQSTRYGGVDSVCVLVCDEFTVCDTIHLAFDIQQDTIGIPFMDDFSYEGPFPSAELWLDRGPFVNNTMSVRPPSIGVATFDGVDRTGVPYVSNGGGFDRLTSKYIDLSDKTDADRIYVSFWLQPKGLGDRPEIMDNMILEFKDNSNTWNEIQFFQGIADTVRFDSIVPFAFYSFPVQGEYLHSGFQFRLSAQSSGTGILDLWHLDYVRVSEDETPNGTFDDVAFAEPPGFLLKNYTSMPWRHFEAQEAQELSEELRASWFNHFPVANVIANSAVQIAELTTGTPLIVNSDFVPFNFNLPAFARTTRTFNLPNDFPPAWDEFFSNITTEFDGAEELEFITTYGISVPNELNVPGYQAIKENNIVSRRTSFKNYFAYDDGTAESTIQLESFNGISVQLAVEYRSNVDDSLRAVQVHFPRLTTNVSDQLFNLRIWKNTLDSEPVYESIFQRPVYASDFLDTLQGFSTYPLMNELTGEPQAIELKADSIYYIGFEQISTCQQPNCTPFGYDLNSPNGYQFLYVKTGDNFEKLDTLLDGPQGAIMVRPVVGSVTPGPTSVKEVPPLTEKMHIFPNPTSGDVFFQLKDGRASDYQVEVYNSVGQLVKRTALTEQISLQAYPSGIYFLKIINLPLQQSWHHKLILSK